MQEQKNEILIYEDDDDIKVEVLYGNENIWLKQEQIALLFEKDRKTITEHIKNIYDDNELEEDSTCLFF